MCKGDDDVNIIEEIIIQKSNLYNTIKNYVNFNKLWYNDE